MFKNGLKNKREYGTIILLKLGGDCMEKKQNRAKQVAVKVIALVLALMMVLAVAATLIFYIVY